MRDPGVIWLVGVAAFWVPGIALALIHARKEWPLNGGANTAFAAIEGTCAALLWPLVLGVAVPAYLVARAADHLLNKDVS